MDPTRRKGQTPGRACATLRRELAEETSHEAEIKNLLWIFENFFDLARTVYRELALIYDIFPTDPTILNNTWTHQTTDGGVDFELRWFDPGDPEHVSFQPAFLKPLLQDPPETPQHIIVREPH